MTLKEFRTGIVVLEKMKLSNPPDFTDKSVEDVWYGAIKYLCAKDFARAIKSLILTNTFFPRVPEIIKAAIPANIISAEEEWGNVCYEIDRCCGPYGAMPDPELSNPITSRVVASMGGLNSIWLDHRDRSYLKREFISHYNKLVSSEVQRALSGGIKKELEER